MIVVLYLYEFSECPITSTDLREGNHAFISTNLRHTYFGQCRCLHDDAVVMGLSSERF